MDFYMFRIEHVDSYVGLQTLQSNEKKCSTYNCHGGLSYQGYWCHGKGFRSHKVTKCKWKFIGTWYKLCYWKLMPLPK
jgi:hypothetical protein